MQNSSRVSLSRGGVRLQRVSLRVTDAGKSWIFSSRWSSGPTSSAAVCRGLDSPPAEVLALGSGVR